MTDAELLTLQDALAGEYSIEREIGRGGMGIVYLAREVQLDRLVAIKVLPADLAVQSDVRDNFLREARTAAGLSHPNIVAIHRVGEAGGLPFFVMAFVDGETLGERLRARGPVMPTALIRILRDVAQALGYAHGHGVIHRDIKPDNILIERGSDRALLTDFGIALATREVAAEGDGRAAGTAQFMSPEQMMGAPLDARSDIYSIGIVGFLAATGTLPHDAPSISDLAVKRLSTDAPGVGSVSTTVPSGLARVIDSCLARDVTTRPESAERLATMLDGASTPMKASLPMALRKWASQPAPFVDMFGIWSVGFLSVSLVLIVTGGRSDQRLIPRFIALAIAPIVPLTIFQLKKTYRALAEGYTIADLRLALREWQAERMEELTFEIGGTKEPMWARIVRFVPPLSLATLLTLIIIPATRNGPSDLMSAIAQTLVTIGGTAFAALTAFGISLFTPSARRLMTGKLRGWLWNGPLGSWLAKRLTPEKRSLVAAHFRPTEMVLQLAVGELFEALPSAYRRDLADLPVVCERLTAHATAVREEIAHLESIGSATPDGESTDTLLTEARADLARTVSALERVRLDLTRLHGGLTDLSPITTTLDAARVIANDIARLTEGQREVQSMWRDAAIDRTAPTPV